MHQITGLTGAAPIWAQIMRSVLTGQPEESFIRPNGLVQVEVCALVRAAAHPGLSAAQNRLVHRRHSNHRKRTTSTSKWTLDSATGMLASSGTTARTANPRAGTEPAAASRAVGQASGFTAFERPSRARRSLKSDRRPARRGTCFTPAIPFAQRDLSPGTRSACLKHNRSIWLRRAAPVCAR